MDSPVREGEVLAGKYRVDKVLGVGGMGVVVAAHHLQLDEKVALKFLLPEMLGNAEAVGRFEREARAAVKIKSEHVARVSDVGKLENGSPYMVMEYLDGGDLAAWVQQRGALPIEQAIEFILQGCEAIAEAHALGIVHRDLKPANLFCIRRPDGLLSVKVLDFGISKATSLGGSGPEMGMTKTQSMMGSPLYMSPEQMQSSKNVDARTDIWALGVILYELVTGNVPFNGEGLPELVLNVVSSRPQPIRNLRPDAPEGLEAVILRCLEKSRERRYANVAELAVALAEFGPKRVRASVERVSRVIQAAGLSTSALALPPSSHEQLAPATTAGTIGSWGRTKSGGATSKVAAAGIAAVLVAGAVAGVIILRRSGDSDSRASGGGLAPPSSVALPAPPSAPSESSIAVSGTPAPGAASSAADGPSAAVPDSLPLAAASAGAHAAVAPPRKGTKAGASDGAVATHGASVVPRPALPPPSPAPPAAAAATKPASTPKNSAFDDRK